jgi:AcrR family transcriptional regulator
MEVKTQAERSEATRVALLRAARDLFTERGYGDTPTEEIVRRAGVTRGALYHHFEDKTDVFAAVFRDLTCEVADKARAAAMAAGPTGSWAHLIEGCRAFLDACLEPSVQRIVLLDAPSVLGWERWRELDAKHGFGLVRKALDVAMESGVLDRQPVDPLAHMVLGALNEAALAMVRADDVQKSRAEVGAAIERLLEGLKAAS